MTHAPIVEALLASAEPSVRWKVRTKVLCEDPGSAAIRALREEIRRSDRVRRLLAPCGSAGVYAKWQGPHWVLASLADLGHPPGDDDLRPVRDRVLDAWLDESYYTEFEATTKAAAYRRRGVPVMRGRHRRCASQQGNALWFVHVLGLADDRCEALAERLRHWQWPDGGWNCDKNPDAGMSSVAETLLPLRGLAVHGDLATARRAAEVLLTRRLLYRRSTGELIRPDFAKLHHPLYWHYDVLGGLRGIAEVGLLGDPRCADALDLLESLRVADGWPAHARHYTVSSEVALHHDSVDWGGTSMRRANPWVTAEALAVLRAAGRLRL